jgi:4-amino-4-deoxy-L-arabinose transferase-like glycosyltransferase
MIKNPVTVERAILAAIIVTYIVLSVLYATMTPPWQAPDEPAHYNYVRHLVEQRRLPVLRQGDYDQEYLHEIKETKFSPEYAIDSIRYEFHQPPLYYVLLVPIYILFNGQLVPLRLFTSLFGIGLLIVTYQIGKSLVPREPNHRRPAWLALGMTAFIAFIPQHIAMTAAVQNDILSELLLGIILLRLVKWLQSDDGFPIGHPITTGVMIGLVLLTKLSSYIALPLALIAILLKHGPSWKRGERPLNMRLALESLAALLLPALMIGLPWFIRNAAVYGNLDLVGLARHDQVVVGQLRTSEWIDQFGWANLPSAFLTTTFRSFWGQFGWMAVPIDWRIYTALRMFSAIAVVGFVFRMADVWENHHPLSQPVILLFCSGILTLLTYLWYNTSYYQAQGRYLYPALIPISLAWTIGFTESLRRENVRWIGPVLALVTLYDLYQLLFGACGEKWKVAIHGAGTAYVGAAFILPQPLRNLLLAVPYLFAALISAISPFLFIVPYLSP